YFQAEDGIRDRNVTGVQTCALPISKTVEDAIIEASIQLGTSSDNIEYEVLDAGSSGFLGLIGGKPAVIQARRKQEELNLDTVERSEERRVGKECKSKRSLGL